MKLFICLIIGLTFTCNNVCALNIKVSDKDFENIDKLCEAKEKEANKHMSFSYNISQANISLTKEDCSGFINGQQK